MGFFSTLGGIAKDAGSKMIETGNKANELAETYRNMSDSDLAKRQKSSNLAEKLAATKVIKERQS